MKKVALIHDYLTEYGGAERVLEAIHELWPEAPIYTSLFDEGNLKSQISNLKTKVQSSKLQRLPLASRLSKTFTFFYPLVFENLDLREYDLVISDGTIWSKSVLTTPEQLHIFYCHTPPRWLWGLPGETDRRRLWYLQPLLKPLDNWLRVWDFETAQRPDFIIANSKTVAARIRKFWRREAKVIYPPVSVSQSVKVSRSQGDAGEEKSLALETPLERGSGESPASPSDRYYLVVSRLSSYKNVDLAIEACNELQLPLKIAGTGREEERLKRLAGPTIEFLGFLEDSELSELYKHCKALIHPVSDEDFGLAPVEAMAHGKPVIALRSGGATETVIDGKTGIFFNEPTVESLVEVLSHSNTAQYRSEDCVQQAGRFSKERFQREFGEFVEEKWRDKITRNA